MRRSRFSESQIIGMLKEQEAGLATADVCRKYGLSPATFYKLKAKFGGLEVSGIDGGVGVSLPVLLGTTALGLDHHRFHCGVAGSAAGVPHDRIATVAARQGIPVS